MIVAPAGSGWAPAGATPPAPAQPTTAPSLGDAMEPYTANSDQPVTYTKGQHTRQATSPAEQVRLEYDGWRRADLPPVERGTFLPPPTTAPPADDTGQDEQTGQSDQGGRLPSGMTPADNTTDRPEPVIVPGDDPDAPAATGDGEPDKPAPKPGRKSAK